MVRVRRSGGRVGLRLCALGAICALGVRALAAVGAEDALCGLLRRAAESTEFVSLALAAETAAVPKAEPTWEDAFLSEAPLYARAHQAAREREAEEAAFRARLAAWEFSPPKPTLAENEFPIKPISINPQSTNGYEVLGKIFLKNDSTKKIDLNALLKAEMPFSLKGEGPHVLIVHTHGSEAYFPEGKFSYTPDDVERTQDKRYNVVRVGDEVEKVLRQNGISVVHDRGIYDSPSYNGSYTRTLEAISAHLKKNPSIKVILDIHRDAMTTAEGVKYKTSATVNGESAAKIMLVMSTGESGLPHPNWQENLKLAVKLQCQIANRYPGLMRPISLRKERFNMHAAGGSMLVEVGTSANSMSEALAAVRPFAKELAALLKTAKS